MTTSNLWRYFILTFAPENPQVFAELRCIGSAAFIPSIVEKASRSSSCPSLTENPKYRHRNLMILDQMCPRSGSKQCLMGKIFDCAQAGFITTIWKIDVFTRQIQLTECRFQFKTFRRIFCQSSLFVYIFHSDHCDFTNYFWQKNLNFWRGTLGSKIASMFKIRTLI